MKTYRGMLEFLKLQTLEILRVDYNLIIIFKLNNNICNLYKHKIAVQLISNRRISCYKKKLYIPRFHSNIHINLLTISFGDIWNSLKVDIIEILSVFSRRV